MSGSNILLILSGSIAAYKACDVISKLVQAGHTVKTVATPSALKFVGAATLEGLTGQRVQTDLWAAGEAMEHIQLTRWADLVMVCPATANTLNRLAAGLGDDLVGALFLAHDRTKPWLVAPAMNPAMWAHPVTTEAVEKLKSWGVKFLAVGEGRTACGESGEGRLAEPAAIVAAVAAALARPVRRLRVLVTSGGTAEPIDGVRVLTNTSSGHTGVLLAEQLARAGHEVVLLRAQGSADTVGAVRRDEFATFADLAGKLEAWLGREEFDAVVHAAAVSDFSVEAVMVNDAIVASGGKLDSSSSPVIRLRPNPKLVDLLRAWSRNSEIAVVAFKLTRDASERTVAEAVGHLFAHAAVDFVVHNDLAERRDADAFPARIYRAPHVVVARCLSRSALAHSLEQLLAARPHATAMSV